MNRNNHFFDHHPTGLFLYFFAVCLVTMFDRNVIVLAVSLSAAVIYMFLTLGIRKTFGNICLYLFITAIIGVTNPLFSHNGVTPLFYMNGMAVTAEAFIYGINSGVQISAVLAWCSIFGACFTEEKISFLFGRYFNHIGVTITVTIRLLKMLKKKNAELKETGNSSGLRGVIERFSMLVTWSLETGVEMSHSMRARGYGKGRRGFYSRFRFGVSDWRLLITFAFLLSGMLAFYVSGGMKCYIYPAFILQVDLKSVAGYCLWSLFALVPFFEELEDCLRWKLYRYGT